MGTQITLPRAGRLLVALLSALAAGTTAFELELHAGVLGGLYRTVATVSLAGLDTAPRGAAALVTTMLLLVAGVAIFGYVAAVGVEVIARAVLTGVIVERRRRRAIEARHDHLIICSHRRVGRRVAEEFRRSGIPNVGADRVVSPLAVPGRVLASLVATPQVAALDLESGGADPDFRFELIETPPGWSTAGNTSGALRVHDETGAAIIAVQKRGGEPGAKPAQDLVPEPDDVPVGVGTAAETHALEELFDLREPVAR